MQSNLAEFLPYLLFRAAEQTSRDFQKMYQARFGMLRTEWRVLFHLGMGLETAKQICEVAGLHKTKVSRAVQALEDKRFLRRTKNPEDRRSENLELTKQGQSALRELTNDAMIFEKGFIEVLGSERHDELVEALKELITKPTSSRVKASKS